MPERIGRRPIATAVRVAFLAAGTAFIVAALAQTWGRARASVFPGWPELALALALALAGLAAAGRGWATLLEVPHPAVRRAFYLSQLGKYIPGMVWQPVGQVGLAARAGVPAGRALAMFPVHALTQLAAGGALGSVLALIGSHLPAGVRAAALAGLAPMLMLRRGWLVRVLGLVRRWAPEAAAQVPSQRAILRSWTWSVATMACSGAAFAVLAGSLGARTGSVAAVSAFALAWSAGFAALPVPAGVGVRELALVALAGPVAPVLAASVAHRLVTIAAEALVIVGSHARREKGVG